MDLPFHPERPCVEVHVIPLQSQNFSPPQPCGQLQQEKLITAVLFGLDQEPLHFLWGKYVHFSRLGGGKSAAVRRVSDDELFFHRLCQCGT